MTMWFDNLINKWWFSPQRLARQDAKNENISLIEIPVYDHNPPSAVTLIEEPIHDLTPEQGTAPELVKA